MKYLIGRYSSSMAYLLLADDGMFYKEKYIGFAPEHAAYNAITPMVYETEELAEAAIPALAESGCFVVELAPELFKRLGGTDLR